MARRCRVLVVEDLDDIGALLEAALAALGYEVELVATGLDAVVRLDLASFDLVVSDVSLPGGKSGLGVAVAAAAQGAGVILISGNPDKFARAAASGHAFLEKPFRIAELQDLAQRVLARVGADCAVAATR